MARNPDFLALTPLDHIIVITNLPYILHFNTADSKAALNTIENGINNLVAHIPWLAGDVIMRSEPDGARNKGYVAFSSSSPETTPMLRVKRFGRDEYYDVSDSRVSSYTMLHTSAAAMSGPSVSSKCLPEQDCSGYALLAFCA